MEKEGGWRRREDGEGERMEKEGGWGGEMMERVQNKYTGTTRPGIL